MIQIRWLHRATYAYLIIPFLVFCAGWLRVSISIPVVLCLLWVIWNSRDDFGGTAELIPDKPLLITFLLAGLWVFLSGVGGYAFQNWDHNWRNVVLHDLIMYDWPVYYSTPDTGPITMLVYYVGYWLPSAFVGKFFGWQFANFTLFLWTWFGVLLLALHLGLVLKSSPVKALLLFIFFSGADLIGVWLFSGEYPTLLPPITHLEIWSGNLQYSSFTTQLFWVFNQAVPAWLCIIFILRNTQNEVHAFHKVLIWSLCFFLAPLASIGLFPYLLVEIFKQFNSGNFSGSRRYEILVASGLTVLISYLYFSANTAAQERGFQSLAIKDFLVFFLLEGGLLWLLLTPHKWRDPHWMVTGLLLIFIPFIQLGSGRDFVMRASISPLFFLMAMTGEALFQKVPSRALRIVFGVVLFVGALTPLYEINRSIYRTFEYYFVLDKDERVEPTTEIVTHLEQPGALESIHPGALTADSIPTLKFMNDKLSTNFIANVRQSIFYKFLAPR
jgi:hypothetical protein